MAGLLDGFLGGSMEDPRTIAAMQLAQGLLGGRGGGMQRLAGGMGAYGATMQQAIDQELKRRALEVEMENRRAQMEQQRAMMAERAAAQAREAKIDDAYRNAMRSPGQQAMAANGGPTNAAAQAAPNMPGGLDQQALIRNLLGPDPRTAAQMSMPEKPNYQTVDGALVQTNAKGGPKSVFERNKPAEAPTSVREFEYGQQNPAYNEWATAGKKAGAPSMSVRVDNKMGDSVAGQIGPMAKESNIKAQGAVAMFDSADRIQKALDSGKVSSGPLTTQINTVKQLVQKVGGGNDEGIRQTRQVIKGLAQMAVEARKELQGQGQVTENEAAAVAKAEAGDINDLTTGELQDLVTLTKRASHFRAKSHQNILESMSTNEATKGTVPFYQVRGMDKLLQHSPQLPQIGGGPSLDDLLNKYGK